MVSKILVVDDDPDVRKTICAILKDKYGSLLEASNGPDALEIIKKKRPRLVLLDVAMPNMSGIEVLKAALAIDPGLKVIMLTSEMALNTAKESMEIGAKQYITKPFEISDLRRAIEDLLEKGGDLEDRPPWRVQS